MYDYGDFNLKNNKQFPASTGGQKGNSLLTDGTVSMSKNTYLQRKMYKYLRSKI